MVLLAGAQDFFDSGSYFRAGDKLVAVDAVECYRARVEGAAKLLKASPFTKVCNRDISNWQSDN